MMLRRSSGSSLADSAVEPTRSQNITVSWRRSASSRRVGSVATGAEGAASATEAPPRLRIARNIFNRCPERNAKVFEMLIGQVGENGHINVVLGKPLSILGHAEFFEPVRNSLHRDRQ